MCCDAGSDFHAECMLIGIDMSPLEYQLSLASLQVSAIGRKQHQKGDDAKTAPEDHGRIVIRPSELNRKWN